jgi:glycosyltransferase involved in cell wall biosynthesis/SAM-dependent methyltransferase
MKVAFFSPMPPAISGIADYSAALASSLGRHAQLDYFANEGRAFDPADHDIALYQIGNNPDHVEAYETALRHPGVVVLHEANLHHLIAAATIRRNDWDGYLREVEYEGGETALAYGHRVRALEVGPDYDGLPMLRRLLSRTRGLIAHSDFVIGQARLAGYEGPAARVPHGAWIPEADRMAYRVRLGLDPTTPLVGTFGHLKPYKRIAESLRAFRRVVKYHPRARMILVGEPHPELRVDELISSLGLGAFVRLVGRTEAIEDFTGYLAACDVILNLRYPTVGETSGTLMRAMGLGKAVLISDVGAFHELPDSVCVKVPVDSHEEELLTRYLTLLVERADLAMSLGARARWWVERECNWDRAAELYASFLASIIEGREWLQPLAGAEPEPVAQLATVAVEPEYIRNWASGDSGDTSYLDTHIDRLEKTLAITPAASDPSDRILEMGAYLQITPSLKTRLGYGEVRGCYYGPTGRTDHKLRVSATGEQFECEVDLFDAEKDRFPYPDGHFTTVLCCELLEHLPSDPMFMMSEINRILKDGGQLVLTTPNIGSLRAISAILQGYHPGFFPAYIRPGNESEEAEARHNREYTPREIKQLFHDGGFTVELLETGPFRNDPKPELFWVDDLLDRNKLPRELRGDGIYAVGVKTSPVRRRWPDWLYS